MAETTALHYWPWKGNRYRAGYRDSLRLLILGESHYGDDDPGATERWTKEHCQKCPERFWTHVEQVVVGFPVQDSDDRQAFWDSVAFSNIVQDVQDRPGTQISERSWKRAREAFCDLIGLLRPDLIFVFSRTAWGKIPDDQEYPGSRYLPDVRSPYSANDQAYLYEIEPGYRVLAGCFNHPRSPGVSRAVWHAWAEQLLLTRSAIGRRLE
jgi:hypothetical protein